MESYLVRIYRRPDDAANAEIGAAVVGLVKPIDGQAPQAFHNVTELWHILLHGVLPPRPPAERADH